MADWPDAWLIVPVFNEERVVADVVRDICATFANVVCVDDGSCDGSSAAIRTTGAHLIRHPVNLGQGAAIQTGLEYARMQPGARYFVTFDADGQHQLEDAIVLLERLRAEAVDIVVGTRFHGDTTHIPWPRRVVLRAVARLGSHSRRLGLTDAHNGLRAFNRTVADRMDITLSRMGHASEIVEMIDLEGWRVVEEPVTIRYTDYSIAKGQSLVNGVNILFETMVRGR
ncbi:MAG TPA: glycosyltransferase family 2 protein [Actinophytocola sp.]|uniref:glycosyltransferase family 2 protein n=1 Tax=Actinophytocola sp. TaxID=1872138 RepID=UPI002DB5D095|nr:glycosyltransferase family 2 protein [Actinophytocola sp.]HEU5470427.1 glycosyltransferase family 2 protein [Actinophytocola sp.]